MSRQGKLILLGAALAACVLGGRTRADDLGHYIDAAPTAASKSASADTVAPPKLIPLPAVAWAGMALFGGIGAKRLSRRGRGK
jgi:hypothetical protein